MESDMPGPRELIAANLRPEPAPGLPEIRLYRAHPGSGLGRFAGGGSAPYWAHLWAGGAVLARHLFERPETIRGRRVLDLGTGSGVVAIAAMRCGAVSAIASDVDPFAIAAAGLNAELNKVVVEFVSGDLLDGPAPECDLILVGDVFYDPDLARRVTAALDRWEIETLVGDMGRKPLPRERLAALASHDVTDFGQSGFVQATVYRFLCR
jgi:predicted nicotinamide N-methyase